MLRDIDQIPHDATIDLLEEQIQLRTEFLPRLTSGRLVAQMREEIVELQRRRNSGADEHRD
jgi:hypothetical protein